MKKLNELIRPTSSNLRPTFLVGWTDKITSAIKVLSASVQPRPTFRARVRMAIFSSKYQKKVGRGWEVGHEVVF